MTERAASARRNCRVKLIERLAGACRAGDLPEYTLEFADSLRTPAKQPPS